MSKELSAEWEYRIINEAKAYAKFDAGREVGYTNAARLYATQLIEAQERIKDLENSMRNIIRAIGAADYLGAKRIANEALSPVNPKRKEDENNSIQTPSAH